MKMILWSIDDHYEPSKHNKWYRSAIKYFIRSYAKFKGSDYFLNKMEDLKNQYEFDSRSMWQKWYGILRRFCAKKVGLEKVR